MAKAKASNDDYNYSDVPTVGPNLMANIAQTAKDIHSAEKAVAEAEEELKERKKELARLSGQVMPELMQEARMTKLVTEDGIEVTIDEKLRASIPADIEKATKALDWLENVGEGGAVKREMKISFGKDEDKWADKFERDCSQRKKPLNMERKRFVHPNTLAKVLGDRFANGEPVEETLFSLHRQKTTKIKVKS